MTTSMEDRIEAYLDGELTLEHTVEVERALARPEVAEYLSQALMVRELLRTAPPEMPPLGLLSEIHDLVQVQLAEAAAGEVHGSGRRFPRLRAALAGASWGLRGPAMAMATSGATRTALDGLSAVRVALGPLTRLTGSRADPSGIPSGQTVDAKALKKAKKARKKAKKEAKKAKKAKRGAKKAKGRGGGLLRRLLRRK